MPLIISNIGGRGNGVCEYTLRVNDQPIIAHFQHDRSKPIPECLRAAARAMETDQKNSDFLAGVHWAINQFENEAYDLQGIRDGYIEAKTTGVHAGRKIDPKFAKACAKQFHERSDAVFMAAESLTKQIGPK